MRSAYLLHPKTFTWYYNNCLVTRPTPTSSTKDFGEVVAFGCLAKIKQFHFLFTTKNILIIVVRINCAKNANQNNIHQPQ